MKLAIKNPAPMNRFQTQWGDYHFGASLERALAARGLDIVQHYWPNWDADDGEEAVLVLRGWHRYMPSRDVPSILWVISHPGLVTVEEVEAYTLVYSASATFRALIRDSTSTPIELLRQCTDTEIFYPPSGPDTDRSGIVFVASARGARRDMAHWAHSARTDLTIVGRNWDKEALAPLRVQSYVPNAQVADIYRRSRLSLNDHWLDMKRFGMISNRIFDSLACGTPVLSDSFPELREFFGNNILHANNVVEYCDAISQYEQDYPRLLEMADEAGARVRREHSFSACAEQILSQMMSPPPRIGRCGASGSQLMEDKTRLGTALRDTIHQDEQKIEHLKEDVSALSMDLEGTKVAMGKLELCYEKLQRDGETRVNRLMRENELLTRQVQSLVSSRSWRLTAPLRKIARAVKSLWLRRRKVNS